MRIDFFRQSDERVVTAFTIQTENKELAFADVGGVQTARMNIYGRITSVAGRRVGVFEDAVTATASSAELLDMKNRKSAYGKTVPLAPGTYAWTSSWRDINSGATQVQALGFTVPKYDAKQLSTLHARARGQVAEHVGCARVGQFTIGQFKVIPNVARTYRKGRTHRPLPPVYNAGIDQTNASPLCGRGLRADEGRQGTRQDARRLARHERRRPAPDARPHDHQRPARPRRYELAVRIKDRVSGQMLSPFREVHNRAVEVSART
jgi:hypothetical protein